MRVHLLRRIARMHNFGLVRERMPIGNAASEAGMGTAHWGCTGFDGIVGGQVSEPWPRATLKAGN